MERATNLSNHITDTRLKETNGVFDNPATFHATVDVFNTDAPLCQVLIEGFLLVRQAATTRFLERREDHDAIKRKREEAKVLQ